jgi:hypothetical protein
MKLEAKSECLQDLFIFCDAEETQEVLGAMPTTLALILGPEEDGFSAWRPKRTAFDSISRSRARGCGQ